MCFMQEAMIDNSNLRDVCLILKLIQVGQKEGSFPNFYIPLLLSPRGRDMSIVKYRMPVLQLFA